MFFRKMRQAIAFMNYYAFILSFYLFTQLNTIYGTTYNTKNKLIRDV